MTLSTNIFLFIFITFLSLSAAEKPNILFIFTDDHAYQAVGAYGGILKPHVKTANIDKLAAEGMMFERCYTTNSICGPMRAVIQTGKYSHVNGFLVNGNKFDGTQQTFPKLLKSAGYTTAVVGKWHLGTHMAPQGYDYSEVLIGQGPYYNPPMRRDADGDGKVDQVVKHVGYTTDIITDLTLDWLKNKRDKSKPFMLMYQHKAPHRNWQPGPKHLTLYDDVTLPEPDTLFDNYEGRGLAAHQQDMTIAETMTDSDLKITHPGNLTSEQLKVWRAAYDPKNKALKEANLKGKDLVRWKYQRYVKDYLRCVASVDENIGRVLKYLADEGLSENTVVIYSSDQGFYLGEHGWFDKRFIYEESLRTPFVVRWPGNIKAGQKNTDIVSPLDFAPTFLEMAGVKIPEDMQGRSLLPIFKGQTPDDWRQSHYYHYYEYPGWHFVRRHYGIVNKRYKLVHFYEKDVSEWELYDLETDPKEMKNQFKNPEYADTVAKLKAELDVLRKKYGVPATDPKDSFRQFRMKPRRSKTTPSYLQKQ